MPDLTHTPTFISWERSAEVGPEPKFTDYVSAILSYKIPPKEAAELLLWYASIADSTPAGAEWLRRMRPMRPKDLGGATWTDAVWPVVRRLRRGHNLNGYSVRWWWLLWMAQCAESNIDAQSSRGQTLLERYVKLLEIEPRLLKLEHHVRSLRIDPEDARYYPAYIEWLDRLRALAGSNARLDDMQNYDAFDVAHRVLLQIFERGGTQP